MNKKGHLLITENYADGLSKRHKFCLKLGCILPDIFVHTYIVGHTWEDTYRTICTKMVHLEKTGKNCCLSYLKLGYLLHYMEDYFTYTHNSWFHDGFTAHVKYEHQLGDYIQKSIENSNENKVYKIMSAEAIYEEMLRLHEKYASETTAFLQDYVYASKIALLVIYNYRVRFVINGEKTLPYLDLMKVCINTEMQMLQNRRLS